MFSSNKQFGSFRDELHKVGYSLRPIWSAKVSDRSKHDDVAMFLLVGDGQPKVQTIIVRDYGRDGFGVWLDSMSNSIKDDIAKIV